MSDWTEDRVNTLKTLWVQGLSGSQIATRLGGVSRCAVLGKVDRLGLPKRVSPHKGTDTQRGKRKPRALAAPRPPRTIVSASPLNEYGAKRPPLISERPNAIAWVDHKDFAHCAMFCHGESGDSGFVCGNPAKEGSVYCSECSRVSYVPGSALAGAKAAA